MDHHTAAKYIIYSPKYHTENKLLRLAHWGSSVVWFVNLIQKSSVLACPIHYSKRKSMNRKILGRWINAETVSHTLIICNIHWCSVSVQ